MRQKGLSGGNVTGSPLLGKEKGRVAKAEVTKVSPELKRAAAQRARDRANAARWNLNVALFLFALLIFIIILITYTKVGIEVVAPVAVFGLAMVWLVGWRQGRQLYPRFYDEELSAGEIVITCAWCGKEMRRERGRGQSIVSHGICPECRQKYFSGLPPEKA